MPASSMKLIHSGKVLKDSDSVETCGIKENDFLVVMVTKPKKVAAPVPAPAPAASAPEPAPQPSAPVASVPAAEADPPPAASNDAHVPAPPASDAVTPADSNTAETPPPNVAAEATPEDPFATPDMVANLTALGFPETEVRHCLRAARGNPDVAVEFLTNGIPAFITGGQDGNTDAPTLSDPPLQALRNHPQFNDLRRLVQSNPAMLQQVLTQIGQQQPDLLREINANQAAFLELMNEPIGATTATTTTSAAPPPAPQQQEQRSTSATSSDTTSRSGSSSALAGADPVQMAQMMQNMDPGQLQMMATMMGLSPEQVQAVGRMIGQLPPDQLQEYMAQAMGGSDGPSSAPPGQHVLRLTEDEMAAVDRLTEMGFDRSEAAQAFLACDKNEALAANLLMDGGFGFGGMDEDDDDVMGGGDDDDDMYS
jgi:UV excision repair protein RAD23